MAAEKIFEVRGDVSWDGNNFEPGAVDLYGHASGNYYFCVRKTTGAAESAMVCQSVNNFLHSCMSENVIGVSTLQLINLNSFIIQYFIQLINLRVYSL